MTQRELNKLLYLASTAENPDLEKVEELLKLGANPLGSYDDDDECTLEEVFVNGQERKYAKNLPALIALFLRYGMDVEAPENDVLHPLTWVRDEYGVQTLQLLMDSGLSAEAADAFAVDLVGDILQFEAGLLDMNSAFHDSTWYESLDSAVKMVLLLASYQRVFDGSEYIRKLMCVSDEGSAAFTSFRNWDVYQCDVVFRDYGNLYSKYYGEKVSWHLGSATVFEKESRKEVRKICLIGYLDIERLEKMKLPVEKILWP